MENGLTEGWAEPQGPPKAHPKEVKGAKGQAEKDDSGELLERAETRLERQEQVDPDDETD